MTVLRRLDAVLEASKPAVLQMKANLDKAGIANQDAALRQAAGQAFYNTSPFTLRDLRNRASQAKLKADFEAYLDGFSPNVQAYLCLETTSQVENEFGYQYLNAYDLLKIIYGYGSGLRQNLDFKDIKRMPVLLPPKGEQAAIVRFLDHADCRIRRAIAAKQKLIRLLEEQKRAIIYRAATTIASGSGLRILYLA